MKKIFKLFFVTCLGFIIYSCTQNDDNAIFNNTSAPTLSADKTSIVLLKENNSANAITFSWQKPDYNPKLVAKNQLQIALKGTNFANPKTVEIDETNTSKSFTVLEMNQILLGLDVPFEPTQLETRIKSSFPSAIEVQPIYSPVLNLTVTPYALVSYLYAVGAFQGWNINNADRLASATSNGIYIGYLNFSEANSEFLIVPVNNNNGYNDKYGSNDNVNLIKAGGNNLKAVNAGQQRITVNLNTLKYNLDPYAMGIVGSGAGGWDEGAEDIPMEYDFATMKWKATATFKTGEIKFRTNRKWSENYGGSNGVLNDGNIPITAGVHTVTLDLVNRVYTVN